MSSISQTASGPKLNALDIDGYRPANTSADFILYAPLIERDATESDISGNPEKSPNETDVPALGAIFVPTAKSQFFTNAQMLSLQGAYVAPFLNMN
jgi:hypothetical protein